MKPISLYIFLFLLRKVVFAFRKGRKVVGTNFFPYNKLSLFGAPKGKFI